MSDFYEQLGAQCERSVCRCRRAERLIGIGRRVEALRLLGRALTRRYGVNVPLDESGISRFASLPRGASGQGDGDRIVPWLRIGAAFLVMTSLVACRSASRTEAPSPPIAAAPPVSGEIVLGKEQMAEDIRQLAATVKSAWAYEDDKRRHFGVDVDRSLQHALARLDNVRSKPHFAGVLREFMASLKEGHAEVFAGHLESHQGRYWPLVLRPVQGGVAVAGGPAEILRPAGIRPGDLLLKADGESVTGRWNAMLPRVSASTDAARRRIALERLSATAAERVELELQDAGGERRVHTLPTVASRPHRAILPEGRFAAWQKLEKNVGYLRIPTFAWQPPVAPKSGSMEDLDAAMQPAKRELDEAFSAFTNTDVLILDLRGNQGGSVFLASYLAEHLLPPGFVYHSGERRRSPEALQLPDLAVLPADHWGKPHPWKPSEMEGVRHVKGPSHLGKLIVLIDELCFSSVDDLTACLADLHPRVRFIGRPTNGGTGEPRLITRLRHSQTDVQFCLMVMRSPKGRLIEGRGTLPHLRVDWSRQDLSRGRDPDIAAAIRHASDREFWK